MSSRPWLLYGATGYTGELIAREAVRRGMRPILAGRSRAKLERLAHELQCPSVSYELHDHTALLRSLENVRAVLHCAGPFSQTARSMMQACLASHVHYADITGEIEVFELAHSVHAKAERADIVLCPGAGFDVVPTDCLALKLKNAMPDATHLALGFQSRSGLSKGTAKTALESLGEGSRLRRDGRIVEEPWAARTRQIDFDQGTRSAVGIPWGDVSTAYYSTGIPNIEVFTATSASALRRMQRMERWRGLLRRSWLQALLKYGIERRLQPPSAAQRDNNSSYLWGEVRNAAGHVLSATQTTMNGYAFTVHSSLAILTWLLDAHDVRGFITPSMALGADFVATLPGSSDIRFNSTPT